MCSRNPTSTGTRLNPTQPSHKGDPGIACSRNPLACTQPSTSAKAAPAYHTQECPWPVPAPALAVLPRQLQCSIPQRPTPHQCPMKLHPHPSPTILAGQNQGGPCTMYCSIPQDPAAHTHSNPSCPTRAIREQHYRQPPTHPCSSEPAKATRNI